METKSIGLNGRTKVIRGLFAALLALCFSANSVIVVHAGTVDDFSAYLGDTVREREVTVIIEPESTLDASSSSSESEVSNYGDAPYVPRGQIDVRLANLTGLLNGGLSGDASATELLKTLSEIERLVAETTANEKDGALIDQILSQNSHLGEGVKQKDPTSTFDTYSTSAITDMEHPYFNIGEIGTLSPSPVRGVLKLITPFGYKVEDGGAITTKNNSIDLSAIPNSKIVAHWSGQVTKIRKDEDGLYSLTLHHGQELFTVYTHLEQPSVHIGKNVKQGETLAIIGDTSSCGASSVDINLGEKSNHLTNQSGVSKENHLQFQVIFKGKYLNPILLFGDSSRPVYEEWAASTNEQYKVDEYEHYFYSKSLSTINPNKNTHQNILVEGAISIEGEYSKPNPGVLP